MKGLGHNIVDYSGHYIHPALLVLIHVQDLKYRRVELFDGIDWQHFRDGWPNIFIKNVKAIAGRDGIIIV